MHGTNPFAHPFENLGWLVDCQVGTDGDLFEVVVGEQGGDLDDHVGCGVEPGHLEVKPCQHAVDPRAERGGPGVGLRGVGPIPTPARVAAVVEIPIVRLTDGAVAPAYACEGDAGADLVAAESITLAPGGGRALVPTGVAIAIPEGFAGFVQPRSGLALRHGVTCLNTPGLIDSGYRGELKVLLVNTDPVEPFEVTQGERIAQLVIQRVEECCFTEVVELPGSERGEFGFGSTGQ